MSNEPRRKFWSVYLSTALVLIFLASIFLALNFTWREASFSRGNSRGMDYGFGWPEFAYFVDDPHDMRWSLRGLGIDGAVFLAALVSCAVGCEFISRSAALSGFRRLLWPPYFRTALMAVALLGCLVWLNIAPRYYNVGCYPKLHACWYATVDGPGWPIPVKTQGYNGGTFEVLETDYYRDVNWGGVLWWRARQWPIFADAAIAGLIVFAVCLAIQWLLRRRESRNTPVSS